MCRFVMVRSNFPRRRLSLWSELHQLWGLLSWWRHQMETFSALLALCAGNSPVSGDFPTQRPVTRSFHVFFDLRLNKRLSKQSWGWWFETLSRSLWRHCNVSRDSLYRYVINAQNLGLILNISNMCLSLTHWGQVKNICVSTLGHNWFN